MILLAAAGAAVLAMVSWAALREAQRMPQTYSPHGTVPRPPTVGRRQAAPATVRPPMPEPHPQPWRVSVPRDVTVADADTAEALAAAGVLWRLMVREREFRG